MEGFKSMMKTFLMLVLTNMFIQQAASTQPESPGSFFYYQQSDYPKDCSDIISNCESGDEVKNGVYYIKPEGLQDPIEVYCDMEDEGWTVIQRRVDGMIDFARNFTYYANGFGFLHKEFWMGGTNLAYLVNQRKYSLKIEITNSGTERSLIYDWFRISDEKSKFQLVRLEGPQGALSDEMSAQGNGTIYGSDELCSGKSGWWFTASCGGANLNGVYGGTNAAKITWGTLGSIQKTTMKVRPRGFSS